jgi:hypothetical protein
MTLGNMPENGVHRLNVSCWNCHHGAVLDATAYPDNLPVPSFGPRMVCTSCGIIGADAMPDWSQRPTGDSLTGNQWGRWLEKWRLVSQKRKTGAVWPPPHFDESLGL